MTCIEFTVNGKKCSVDVRTPRDMTLNAYLRYVLALPGTKAMCYEGGCGACSVSVRARRETTGNTETFSVNSCLVLVFSCHGWDITTIEGVGNRHDGYSDIQNRFKAFNATQCGYCTPGWIMNLYSLQDKHLTTAELEKSFGSNTCRCTGYRPILDVIKSYAVDASPELCQRVKDIEDLKICDKNFRNCQRKCSTYSVSSDWSLLENSLPRTEKTIVLDFGKEKMYKVFDEEDIFDIFNKYGVESYQLVDGNTAKGIYETYEYPRVLIDISNVKSLKGYQFDQNLIIGANTSLEECRQIFNDVAHSNDDFSYLSEFAKHFESIAHIPVRNIGSLAGNLMLKHSMPSFPSDVFLLLSAVGAVVTVRNSSGQRTNLYMTHFLKYNMQGVLMLSIALPPLGASNIFKSYKIMPRNQNAVAIVNAAFLINMSSDNKTIKEATIVFGNISTEFIYAKHTEDYLRNKNCFDNKVLQGAIKKLHDEICPEENDFYSKDIRKKLAIGLFYKFALSIAPSSTVDARYRSGGELLQRPISHGTQDFQTDSSLYPLNQPLPKLEALLQSSGEAQFVNDIPPFPLEVFGAFVLSTIHVGQIDSIDTTDVLKIDGVLAVYTAKDIPGANSFIRPGVQLESKNEEILVSSNVKYYGQPLAIVVATSQELAANVANKVKVTYKNISFEAPVTTIDRAKKDSKRYVPSDESIDPKGRGSNVTKTIKGLYEVGTQFHYYMEPISCVVVPVDDGLEVYESTQWMDLSQIAIAQCLDIKESQILMKVRRCGGAFGGKISRNVQAATACALVAHKLTLPCRFILPMQTNMSIVGGRFPTQCDYEVGVDDDGEIQYLQATVVQDQGYSINDSVISYTAGGFPNCYNSDYMSVKFASVFTDLPCNTFMRAPGTSEGIICIENIMEHIAYGVQKDATDVRLTNMRKEDNDLPQLIDILKKEADYDERKKSIQDYNKSNRWIKKAIHISPMIFPVEYYGNYSAMVSIYRGDGTVTITTGGIEMGQGLNTKAAQVCAHELNIPLRYISVLPSMSFVAANNVFSGSSITSESVCYSIIKACEILNKRLEPVKQKLTNPTWEQIAWKAGEDLVDLTAKYMMTDQEKDLSNYSAFGVAILETQLDVLTGRYELLRADILEDVGLSANPTIDVGQLEGGYIQGLGYFTTEKMVYDEHTGKKLSNRSLTYHVPLALDIPADFRVKFRYNSKNHKGVLGSKTVGEMGICTAYGVTHALRRCIMESRKESGYDPNEWINIDVPYTPESVLKALAVKLEEFVFKP
ncbi:uncharacterized protein LOC113513917 [Galleria mellonella]|uniref:Uncharacterized protein LOC113513917 n=1 Tax=Galleria mellonella TaxID=7137 RepID=A0ABM3MH40_GALME|nr:uncharacterized protein LOC113513917 [Galleria mellonella]